MTVQKPTMGNKQQTSIKYFSTNSSFFAPKSSTKHSLDEKDDQKKKELKLDNVNAPSKIIKDGKLMHKLVQSSDSDSPEKSELLKKVSNLTEMPKINDSKISNELNSVPENKEAISHKPKGSTSADGKEMAEESVFYGDLCSTFDKIEATTKRLVISSLLTEYFQKVIATSSPQTLVESVYLCLNRLGPEYEGKELGIGESLLIKAIASATGRTPKSIKADVVEKGDLGLVAQSSKGKQALFQKPKPHTIHSMFTNLQDISNMTGNQSQQKKIDRIQKMLTACSNSEPKYLIRSLEGKLRIGLAQQTILIALTHAIAKNEVGYKELKSEQKRTVYLQDSVVTVKQVFRFI
jgi:DNA ligase-1